MATIFTTGVRNLVITPITEDTVSTLTFGSPISVVGVRGASWSIQNESFEHRGDDTLLEVSQVIDKCSIEMETMGVDLNLLAILTGGTFSTSCVDFDYFCHNLQEVGNYYQIDFDALCTDGKFLKVKIGKAKISAGPNYNHADKTPGMTTFTITSLKLYNQSGDTKGVSIRKIKV